MKTRDSTAEAPQPTVSAARNASPPWERDRLAPGEARLELLAATTSTVVWYTAKDGRVTQLNPSWEAFTGQTPDEYAGWGWLAATHPQDRERVAATWKAAASNRQLFQLEYRLRRKDGEYRHVQALATPAIRGEEVVEWVGVCSDVTATKQLEMRLRFMDRLTQATRFLSDPHQIARLTCELLREYLGATSCGFCHPQPGDEGTTLKLEQVSTDSRPSCQELTGIYAERVKKGGHLLFADLQGEPPDHIEAQALVRTGVRALICMGLVREGRLLCAIAACQDSPRQWTSDDIDLVAEVQERCWDYAERARTMAERERARMKLEMAVEAADLVLAEIDYRTGVNHLSAELARLLELGAGPIAVPRQAVFDRIHPEDRQEYLDAIATTLDPKGSGHLAIRVRTLLPSGTVRWLDIRLKVTFASIDGQLKPDRGYCAAHDVTSELMAQRKLHATQLLTESVMDNAGALIYAKDLQGHYVLSNQAFRKLLGFRPEALEGFSDRQIVAPEFAPGLRENDLTVARTGKPVVAQEKVVRDGKETVYRSSRFPLFDDRGDIYAVCGISTDITDVVQAEQRKDEFIATLAHELRNPLAPIRTGLEILKRTADMPASTTHIREMMERQLGHLIRLVDDLLDVSRITHDKLEIKRDRLRLSDIVEHALETSRPAIDAAGHDLVVHLPSQPVWIEGDLTRLAQCLSNLINNAARYTPARGRIELVAAREQSQVNISISDNGAGIDPAVLDHLFELFSQAQPDADRLGGGLGIGLWLVKKLVELHGGTVHAQSEGPGRGAAFTVRLPLLPAALVK